MIRIKKVLFGLLLNIMSILHIIKKRKKQTGFSTTQNFLKIQKVNKKIAEIKKAGKLSQVIKVLISLANIRIILEKYTITTKMMYSIRWLTTHQRMNFNNYGI